MGGNKKCRYSGKRAEGLEKLKKFQKKCWQKGNDLVLYMSVLREQTLETKLNRISELYEPWKLNNERKGTLIRIWVRKVRTKSRFRKRNKEKDNDSQYREMSDWALEMILTQKRKNTIFREFDPGSGRTLAACLTHASRTKFIWNATSVKWSLNLVADGWVTREQPAFQRGITFGNER